MHKTFPLAQDGKHPDRVLEAVKHETRKYIKRERRRELPSGVDFWDFDCLCGDSKEAAAPVHPAELINAIDAVAKAGAAQCYVAVVAKNGVRSVLPREPVLTHAGH